MLLTTSGNLGLGVTPSAWNIGTALQIATGPSILGFNNETFINTNAYYNGTNWIYKLSSYAPTLYVQNSLGNYVWNTAPSGTAGAAITFTQAMTLTASGNVGIGTASPNITGYTGTVLTVGNGTSNSFGIEVYGGTTGADGSVGDLAFLNSYATGADKRIAIIRGLRTNDNNSGGLTIYSKNAGTLTQAMTIAPSGAATFSSSITSNLGSGAFLISSSSTTNSNYLKMTNTGGDFYYGLDNSGGGSFGNAAYSGNLYMSGDYPMLFWTHAIERMRITSGGTAWIGAYTSTPSTTSTLTLGKSAAPSGYTSANMYLQIGGMESGASSTRLIGFGYSETAQAPAPPAYIGYITTSTTGFEYGDLIFGTRSVTTNTAATERMRITSGGNVGINTSASTVKLYTKSDTATSASYAFGCENGSVNLFLIRGDGLVSCPLTASVWTTGNSANMWINPSGGDLYRSTSSIKYKKNVQDYNKGLAEVLKLRPVSYEGISEIDGDKQFAGLIAEEVHELGLIEFVVYAEDGSPDALAYQNMIALAFKAIQEQQATITSLQEQITELKQIVATK